MTNRQQVIAAIVLVVVVVVLASFQDVNAVKEQEEDLKSLLWGKIFGEKLYSPEETLEIFKTLKQEVGPNEATDAGFDEETLKIMINISDVDQDKCTVEVLKSISNLVKSNLKSLSPTISAYIKHYSNAQFLVCQSKIHATIGHLVETISKRRSDSIYSLTEHLFRAKQDIDKNGWTYKPQVFQIITQMTSYELARASLAYMKEMFETKSSLFKGDEWIEDDSNWFREKYNEIVNLSCKKIVRTFKKLAPVLKPFTELEMAAEKDYKIQKLVVIYETCNYIVKNEESIILSALAIYHNNNNNNNTQ